ncbi:MAG TPA: hypothetical protein VFD69_05810 [Vicinamibacterales bacterium]|nr:hypothetical protein [Vicinamibacterales bacterium]
MRALLLPVAVALAVTLASPALSQTPADPSGHWEGTVTAPMGQIDFEVDVARDASGTLVAVYGQKATGARGLPLTVTLTGRTLTFVLFGGGAGGGAFKGDILPDGKTISGEASSPLGSAPFMMYRTGEAVMPKPIKNTAVSAALAGRWTGSLDVGGTQLGLILTIANRADGTASVQIGQAAQPNALVDAALKENGTAVSFEVPATSGSWTGTLDGDALTGTWTQSRGSLPLTFTRAR